MRGLYKIGITVSVFLVLTTIFIFDDLISFKEIAFHQKYSLNYVNDTNIPTKEELQIPDIFKLDLRRPTGQQEDMVDRIELQWQWIVNLSKSEYAHNVKRKRLLVPTTLNGGFLLDDIDRNFICHSEGVNMSAFCEMVEDLWYYPMYPNYDEVDAVIERRDWIYDFYEPKIPPSKNNFFSIQESPYTVHQADFSKNNPMLASYWRGSDVVTPYHKWMPYATSSLKKSNGSENSAIKNYASGKSKLAAIVVSHCPTANGRLGYVEELQKYIPVDVYGACGSFHCPPNSCFDMIEEKYKFYLAFENANCRDYITEKFFVNGLQRNIVPIVYGAHRNDYKFAAPPHSYIHVEDFASPKELADFIVILDQNDEMYNEYFNWKGTGELINGGTDLFCRICAMLFYADFHPPNKWPKDSRWSSINTCLSPGEMYWERER